MKTSFKHKSVKILSRNFIDSFICFESVLCIYYSLIVFLWLLQVSSRMIFCIVYLYFLQRLITRHFRCFDRKMKSVFQITVLSLSDLIAASSFNCSLVATETVISRRDSLIQNVISVTSASRSRSTKIINSSDDYMTISITNAYETQLSLLFASNVDESFPLENSSVIVLLNASSTQYVFSTEWARRIYVDSNINSLSSKIEGSITDSLDINISYVNDYFVLITCSFEDVSIFDCNLDLFKQFDIKCNNQMNDSVYLNFAQNIVDESASLFFAACAETVYAYSNDNEANVSNLWSNLISCCIDMKCEALSRQLFKTRTLNSRSAKLNLERKIWHHHHWSRSRVHR